MPRLAAIVFALLLTLPALAPAQAQNALTVRESKFSVKETVDRLVKALESKGIKVAARIDHAAGAKAVDMALPPAEVVLFGNPKLGTPLMQANPQIGLDLPMKMLVWQDKAGKVWLAYAPAAALQTRYAIKDKDPVFKTMAGALEAFAKAATGAN